MGLVDRKDLNKFFRKQDIIPDSNIYQANAKKREARQKNISPFQSNNSIDRFLVQQNTQILNNNNSSVQKDDELKYSQERNKVGGNLGTNNIHSCIVEHPNGISVSKNDSKLINKNSLNSC